MSVAAIGANPQQVDDSPQFDVGTVMAVGSKQYVYVKADGAISKGAACIIHKAGEADEVTTTIADDSYPLCIPQVAIADDKYGWGLIVGPGEVEVNANCAANTSLSTTNNAGRLDDVDSAGRVSGLQLTSARGANSGLAPCWCFMPRLDILD